MLETEVTPDRVLYMFDKFVVGDEKAFSFFYKYFIKDLYAYGRSLGAEEAHVMDSIQDVFLKIFSERPVFISVEHLKYFLFRSLKNRLYDLFKSKTFSGNTSIDGDNLTFSIKTTILDEIIEEEDRIIIKQKIEKLFSLLSSLQKEALYLRYIQGLKYSEISEIMDRSEVSIRKLVSEALIKIRKENNILPMLNLLALFFGAL